MQAWQQRVVDEKKELDVKIGALNEFLNDDYFNKLNDLQKQLLEDQFEAMATYSNVLNLRIVTFSD